jgi:hypothetical protein
MRQRKWLVPVAVAAVCAMSLIGPRPAAAQTKSDVLDSVLGGLGNYPYRSDRYGGGNGNRSGGYYGNRSGSYGGLRGQLQERAVYLEDWVRRAESGRAITRREGDDYRERLSDVRRFLRNDRELTREEFDRWDNRLDDIEDDLQREAPRYGGRYGSGSNSRYGYGNRNGRYDDAYRGRYDRYDPRYDDYRYQDRSRRYDYDNDYNYRRR